MTHLLIQFIRNLVETKDGVGERHGKRVYLLELFCHEVYEGVHLYLRVVQVPLLLKQSENAVVEINRDFQFLLLDDGEDELVELHIVVKFDDFVLPVVDLLGKVKDVLELVVLLFDLLSLDGPLPVTAQDVLHPHHVLRQLVPDQVYPDRIRTYRMEIPLQTDLSHKRLLKPLSKFVLQLLNVMFHLVQKLRLVLFDKSLDLRLVKKRVVLLKYLEQLTRRNLRYFLS